MKDIIVNIIDGVVNITQKGFGVPAIYGETEQFKSLITGSGKSKLVWVSADRGGIVSLEILQAGASITFTIDSSNVVTLTIPTTGASAKEVYTAFQSASVSVTNEIDLLLYGSGIGQVEVLAETALENFTERVITSKDQLADLLFNYLETDQEYLMVSALLNQELAPEKIYLFNAYEASPSDIATKIIQFDNQDYYFLLLSEIDKPRIVEANTYCENNNKVLVALCDDYTILDELSDATASMIVIADTDNIDTRPECCIVGLQAPKIPGSTSWKFQRVNGAVAELDSTLIDNVRADNGNLFIKVSGITYYVDGKMTNGLFIDQKRGRDYIQARIEESILSLFVAEDKIPYDDSGIGQVRSTLNNALNGFGEQGIIARAVSPSEVEASYNGRYQYNIFAPTRDEVLANSALGDIPNREYTVEFSFVEAGAIGSVTITGKVLLVLG